MVVVDVVVVDVVVVDVVVVVALLGDVLVFGLSLRIVVDDLVVVSVSVVDGEVVVEVVVIEFVKFPVKPVLRFPPACLSFPQP